MEIEIEEDRDRDRYRDRDRGQCILFSVFNISIQKWEQIGL